jgi:3-dehydroquinate synthase
MNALENERSPRLFAVIDVKVKNMLPQWLQFSPDVFWIQQPEAQKCLDVFAEAANFFLKQGIQRDHTIIGIGGGATTDLAGFIAATIHRGVRWIAMPTTLMGMVDAAIGGKTAINMSAGKNLLGAFHAPDKVWICTDYLRTLSSQDVLSGRGEILKYGLLSQKIYDTIMLPKIDIDKIILECADFKKNLVNSDFKETGERAFLNLGHTLGHAFEHTLKISHGIAVTMGIKYILKAFQLKEPLVHFEKLFKQLNLDDEKTDLATYTSFDKIVFWSSLSHDKKNTVDGIKVVLVSKVGEPYFELLPLGQLKAKIEALSDFKN